MRARSPRTAISQVLLAGARSSQTSLFFSQIEALRCLVGRCGGLPGRIVLLAEEEARRCRYTRDRCRSRPRRSPCAPPWSGRAGSGSRSARPAVSSTSAIMLPRSAPSVSIFEATTTLSRVCAFAWDSAARNGRAARRARPPRRVRIDRIGYLGATMERRKVAREGATSTARGPPSRARSARTDGSKLWRGSYGC